MGVFDSESDGQMDAEADWLEEELRTHFSGDDGAAGGNAGYDLPLEEPPEELEQVHLPFDEDPQLVPKPIVDQASSSDSQEQTSAASPEAAASSAASPASVSSTCGMSSSVEVAGPAVTATTSAVKRRRLTSKTTVPDLPPKATTASESAGTFDIKADPKAAHPHVQFPSSREWELLTHRERWQWIHRHVRSFWVLELRARQTPAGSVLPMSPMVGSGATYDRHLGRKLWARLEPLEKRAAGETWAAHHGPPVHVASVLDAVFPETGTASATLVGTTALLTWIGPWGIKGADNEWLKLPAATSLDELVKRLRSDSVVKDLWERMLLHVEELRRKVGAQDAAVCLEICPNTLETRGLCRLHFHCYLRNSVRLRLPPSAHMRFDGAVPQQSSVVGGMALSRRSNSWSGYFYCVVPKTGQIWSAGSRRPFKDFLVDGKWVMNLLQAEKISPSEAREHILRCGAGARRHLDDIALAEKELERKIIEADRQRVLAKLQPEVKPFREIPEVEEWKSQYSTDLMRYKFLVLVGPSRMGKTQYARSLVEPAASEIYEVNCSSGKEPDMRSFVWSRHKLILFDESHPAMVTQQRLLFQAGTSYLQLGSSATNCHSYSVYVHRTPMVLCTNSWQQEVRDLVQEDREWLEANAVVVNITVPCWLD